MTNKLKERQGFALTGVIVLIAVLTLFGTAMYSYSMQALKVLEFGTNRQKAEYLARSGIEASVFMYQDALLREGNADDTGNQIATFLAKSTDDAVDATDETITTNWIYMLKSKDADGNLQYADGGTGDSPAEITEDYIGYFKVEITNDKKKYDMPTGEYAEDGITPITEEKTEFIKRFKSMAYVKGSKSTKNAYIVPVVDIGNKGWIRDDGTINLAQCTSDATSVIFESTVSIDCGAIDQLAGALSDWFGIGTGGKRLSKIPVYLGNTSGNMVIPKPANADSISFKYIGDGNANDKTDNVAGFISLSNIFVEAGIDVKPDKSRFNFLYLRGNQIVVDDQINLYVYDPGINSSSNEEDSNFWTKIVASVEAIRAKLARNYRLGTLVIGTPSTVMTTVTDPMPTLSGGLGDCGQIFFGGDVYVNFMTSEGTRKYKLFNAGDVYYFDGDFMVDGKTYGVDLVKYFLDTARQRGYSSTVLRQFERTEDFYYNQTSDKYSLGSMRKVELGKNVYDGISDIIVPSSGDTAYIIWD